MGAGFIPQPPRWLVVVGGLCMLIGGVVTGGAVGYGLYRVITAAVRGW